MRLPLVSLAAVALLAGAVKPAGAADDASTVRSRVSAAMQAAKSFVFTVTSNGGLDGTTTYVAPDRYHSALTFGGNTYDVVIVGSRAYVNANREGYQQLSAPPQFLETTVQLRNVPVDAILPDTTVNGTTYGQFATSSAGPQHDQHLTCTYDKATYRIARCASPTLTIAFDRYDDPANVVTVPAVAPAPAASPR
jgi:hypothetical protein